MEWTIQDRQHLLEFRDRIDDDNTRCKQIIKKKLLDNKYIIHVLDNKELEDNDAEPDDYYNVNIRPAYVIPETQTDNKNFICFTVGWKDVPQWNKQVVKYLQITFTILCYQSTLIDKDTSLPRHDLLAALIKDEFNYSLAFGDRIQIASDLESVVDNNYCCRTLVFETMTDRDIVKYKNSVPTIINKSMHEV